MRGTVSAAILLVGLGATGLGMVHCGATTSPVGAMNDVVHDQACSPVGSMAKASDGCDACTCSQSGQWACTSVACAASEGGADSADGPGGVSCAYSGASYRPGDIFASADGCNSCACTRRRKSNRCTGTKQLIGFRWRFLAPDADAGGFCTAHVTLSAVQLFGF